MKETTISENIYYIGVDDTDIDLFESQYPVPNGITYNSYLIIDDKIAIMDTVDRRKCTAWWDNIEQLLRNRVPDYLIVQHMEPDHTGTIAEAIERYPQLQVVASARAVQMLPQFFGTTNFSQRTIAVKEGDTLSLGRHTLQFFMAPMVHWPEVMVTYEQTQRIIFSADAFGTFGTLDNNLTLHKTDSTPTWPDEARRYYYNICGKYGVPVQALLKKLTTLDLAFICPLHGPILTNNLAHYINLYDKWSKYEAETEGILIAYATIHGGTGNAAHHMAELLRAKGTTEVTVLELSRCDMSDAVAQAFRSSRLIVAASSYDASVFPPMYDFLHHLQLKGYQKRRVGIIENGSWAPSAGRIMKEMLEKMKEIEIVDPLVTIRSTLKPSDHPMMEALADAILI